MMNKIVFHAFFTCTLFLTGISGAIIQRPLNAATSVGGQTVFNCSSNTTASITWLFTIQCDSGFDGVPLTENNCEVISSHNANYETDKPPGGFICNLIVSNALLSLGGCYTCFDGIGAGGEFQGMLIVVESNASMSSNSTEIMPGEAAVISNSIPYRGPSIPLEQPPFPPSFYWTLQSDPSQNITSYPGLTTDTSASSYIVVTAQLPNVPPYICHLFFNPPTNVPSKCANNTPNYTNSWATATYPVSYSPENISISQNMTQCPYNESLFITCNASGYPIPAYTWFDLTNGGEPFHGSTIRIDRGGIYQCVASNIIRDVTYSESMSVNVSDCFTYVIDDKKPQPSECDPGCIAILVIAIYFGLNLLFFTVFIICYGCSKSGRNTMNDRFPWLIKMLPCMNDEGCKCSVWIFYFVLLSIFAAFIFFPVILIMSSCCKKKQKANPTQSERNGRGAGSTQLSTLGATPTYQHPARTNVTPNPPSPLNTSGHFQQDPLNRPYPHSNNQQHQPEYWGNSGPYPQNPRNPRPPPRPSPSPLSTGGIVYAELGVDNQPMSRRPIQPIQDASNTYADIALA